MKRVALLLVVAAIGVRESRACTRCLNWIIPTGGDVPANLPGLTFGYIGPPLNPPLVMVTEVDRDGVERRLGLTFNGRIATFQRPLVEGASYRVQHPGCGQFKEIMLHAVAPAAFPNQLGTVALGPEKDDALAVPSSSSTCSTLANVRGRNATLTLSPEAIPWRTALDVQWSSDNGAILGPNPFAETPDDWSNRFVFQICSIAKGGTELEPTPPPRSVAISASIPGATADIAPIDVAVSVDCDVRGCASGPTSVAGPLFLMLLRRVRGLSRHTPEPTRKHSSSWRARK